MNGIIGSKTTGHVPRIDSSGPDEAKVKKRSKSGTDFKSIMQQKSEDIMLKENNPTGQLLATKVQKPETIPIKTGIPEISSQIASLLSQNQSRMDSLIEKLNSGKPMSPKEILSIQDSILRYSRDIELAMKLIEQLVSGIKTVMQTQV